MPFVQMENISLFLRACQSPPLNLQQHDVFLTVDLYEQKDPTQVLQCLGAFSRAAHQLNPSTFPGPIGAKSRSAMSPQSTGLPTSPLRGRNESNASTTSSAYNTGGGRRPPDLAPSKTGGSVSGRWSPTKSPSNGSTSPGVAVSSWSRREHEGQTAPAWNIAQYGYMGGASQGNLGIAFGGRRQITSASPYVPSLAEKERKRKEQEAEEERKRAEAEEEERRRRAEAEAEEERARIEEERRWEAETRKAREDERRRVEEEKRQWEEEERMWKLTEEKRRKEEEEAQERLDKERRSRARSRSRGPLRGQYLSQYKAEQGTVAAGADDEGSGYTSRIKELERELELARQREQEYERERLRGGKPPPPPQEQEEVAVAEKPRARSRSRASGEPMRQDSWVKGQREYLSVSPKPQHQSQFPPRSPQPQLPPRSPQPQHQAQASSRPAQPPPPPRSPKPQVMSPSRPLPDPMAATSPPPVRTHNTGGRPLPNPAAYTSPPPAAPAVASPPAQPPMQPSPAANRTDRFLASNPAPQPAAPHTTYSRELDVTSERDAEDRRRVQQQAPTKAGGWASKSLLEREMEMERQRQKEWEDAQRETAEVARRGGGEAADGVGGRWDVSQWSGYTGGDNQNQVGTGIGAGRRQIVGPRPLPGPPR